MKYEKHRGKHLIVGLVFVFIFFSGETSLLYTAVNRELLCDFCGVGKSVLEEQKDHNNKEEIKH